MRTHRYSLSAFWGMQYGDFFHNSQLGQIISQLPLLDISTGPWIAGGSVRRTVMGEPLGNDVDVFFANEAQFEQFRRELGKTALERNDLEEKRRVAFQIAYAYGRSIKIDLVRGTYFANTVHLLSDFDFTCCCLATDGDSLDVSEYALLHAAQRILKINNQEKMHCSLDHMERYLRDGFKADARCLDELLQYGRKERIDAKCAYSGPSYTGADDVESKPTPSANLGDDAFNGWA